MLALFKKAFILHCNFIHSSEKAFLFLEMQKEWFRYLGETQLNLFGIYTHFYLSTPPSQTRFFYKRHINRDTQMQ